MKLIRRGRRTEYSLAVVALAALAALFTSAPAGSSKTVSTEVRVRRPQLLRIWTPNEADKTAVRAFASGVEDHGTFVVAEADVAGVAQKGLDFEVLPRSIHLPGATFEPPNDRGMRFRPTDGPGYYVVQFSSLITSADLDAVERAGGTVIQYVPHQAYFVYAGPAAADRISRMGRVRWLGRYLPEQKVSPVLRAQITSAQDGAMLPRGVTGIELLPSGRAAFDVAVFSRADLDAVATTIESLSLGGSARKIELPNNFFNIVRIELPIDAIDQIAALDDVFRIDYYGRPEQEDERSSQIVAGNYTSPVTIAPPGYAPATQFGFDGTNVTVAIVDDGVTIPGQGGFYITSANAVDADLHGAAPGATSSHGHLNASIVGGRMPFSGILDPLGYNYGLGVAPGVSLLNVPYILTTYLGSEADAYNDVVNTPGTNGVLGTIANNSWGAGANAGVYDSYTAMFDGFVRDASFAAGIDPISLIFSAGNQGPAAMSVTRPHNAKNLIAVGNSENIRPEFSSSTDNMDDLDFFSSRGPAADGRLKPDIVAPGAQITGGRGTATCSGAGAPNCSFDAVHASGVGTSHAAPQVAGAAAIFTQYWKFRNGNVNPSPAMIKAAILNTGQEMNGSGTASPLPNTSEGWGRLNMKFMIDPTVAIRRIDQTTVLTAPGDSLSFSGSIADASKPVRVALVWTDPPAAGDPALVNDLNLSVTVGGTPYKGNVFSGGISITGGAFDTLNNVEMVRLPPGTPGGTAATITVTAAALNGDGVLGNADLTDQHFALVVYNFGVVTHASEFEVTGRVVGQDGNGVPHAIVRLTDPFGRSFQVMTGSFGYFRFDAVPGPQTYTATVTSKRFQFEPQSFALSDDLAGLDFIAGPPN
jgi:hypothetical protein